MNLRLRTVVAAVLVIAAAALSPPAFEKYQELTGSGQYQLILREEPRSWFLDTRSIRLQSEEDTGIKYLDITVKQTYTFTTSIDYTSYWLRLDARKWQPVTATGCDADGNVIEL